MEPLTVVLLRLLYGRVGSTLLMQLLATSEEVVCDRIMPYERRYLAHFVDVTRPERSSMRNEVRGPQGSYCIDEADLARNSLAALWKAFSNSARIHSRSPAARYYIEKSVGPLDPLIESGISFRIIDVVRDPRDIYVSARDFCRNLGRDAFGIRHSQPDAVNIPLFLCDIAARLQLIGEPAGNVTPILVRYEDLTLDLPATAERIGRCLGIALDPTRVLREAHLHREHMTSTSPAASVGRWRTELGAPDADLLTRMLSQPMELFGYKL